VRACSSLRCLEVVTASKNAVLIVKCNREALPSVPRLALIRRIQFVRLSDKYKNAGNHPPLLRESLGDDKVAIYINIEMVSLLQ